MILRVPKEKAAFLYQLLESYEGLVSHSTVTDNKHLLYRDICLQISPEQKDDLLKVLSQIQKEIAFEYLE